MFKVENLTFKYPKNSENTIKGISFEINPGEIFGFLGPSGAGKSTTQKILIKLLNDYQGDIEYVGKDLKSYRNEFFEEIGVGFEMPVQFSKLTAYENLNFFKKLYKSTDDIDELLKKVGLYEDRDKLVGEYSKGMKMRLNFIRAFLNKPKILFLDEPTNGLDPKNSRIVKDIILDFKNNGGTVFLTSHIMGDVDELCDRVAFIAEGKITEIDSPRSLKLKYGKRTVTVEYRENKELIKKVYTLDNLKDNEELFSILKTKDVETIHSGETTLEEIFIKVTGVALNEG